MKSHSTLRGVLLLQGICVAFAAMFAFSLILAVITLVSEWQESLSLLAFLNYLSIFFGAAYVGKRSHNKLWLNGALVGILYILLITVIKSEIGLLLQWALIKRVIFIGFIGMLGGLAGGIFAD